jgi:hypothetical protein
VHDVRRAGSDRPGRAGSPDESLTGSGRITLNSDQGTLAQLTQQPFPTVPQVIRDRRHGEGHTYEVIPLEQLTAY